jgi:hypothetical protein
MKNRRTSFLRAAALSVTALVSLAATQARADANGYVCNVNHSPLGTNAGFGNYGYVYATMYSSPKCAGGYLGAYFFCSDGNNHPYCHTGAYHSWFDIPPLLTMLQNASTNGTRTTIYTGACKLNGGNNCAISVNFTPSP